jgi:hypothetical protein
MAAVLAKGASEPSAETITIRPDAQTGKQSWPCRELKDQRTPNAGHTHSRFGEAWSSRRNGNRVMIATF